ncbi:MAG: hypothetical protein HY360_21975 [Verrucomicrobia bacterium]|nr:hypothetical protein [Verrucomicrobiota bacterium]
MIERENGNPYFVLPEFDVPQREHPCLAHWTYEEAVRAFEEMAEALKLRERPLANASQPQERFEL